MESEDNQIGDRIQQEDSQGKRVLRRRSGRDFHAGRIVGVRLQTSCAGLSAAHTDGAEGRRHVGRESNVTPCNASQRRRGEGAACLYRQGG